MTVIEGGVASVEPPIVIVGGAVIARKGLLIDGVTERVGELRAEVVPTARADRNLERVVARVCPGLDFGDTTELRKLADERPARIRRRCRTRPNLIDVVRVDQLPSLVAHVSDLQQNLSGH